MLRRLFYVVNFLMLAVFVAAYVIDYRKEWRDYQKEYFRRTGSREPVMVRQIIAKDLILPNGNPRVDRCITCHAGMDEFANPSMTTPFKEQPFTGHPDLPGLVKNHPFQKYGCTVCHAGQGLATTKDGAHGREEFWEKPLLHGALIQASCAKCHANFERLKGAEAVARGRRLMEEHGCFGCHSIRGAGGVVSVDLGNIADKPLERVALYNFSLIKTKDAKPLPREEWKLPAWIEAHLTNDPMDLVPNDPFARYNKEPIAPSGMPDFSRELPAGGAEAVTAYLLSLTEEELVPNRYFVPASPRKEPSLAGPVERGRYVYRKYGCAGCHGLDAREGRRNYNAMGKGQADPAADMDKGRAPTLIDTVATFTPDELKKKIQDGVPSSAVNKFNPAGPTPPLYMPVWKDRIRGRELDDLAAYLQSIAKKTEEW